jgi:transposase InsO family protein
LSICSALAAAAQTCAALLRTLLHLLAGFFRSKAAMSAEVAFLRIQLAACVARGVKPRNLRDSHRLSLLMLGRLCNWRAALLIVSPATFVRWHRSAWRLLWRIKSRGGRPPLTHQIRSLIRRMSVDNGWGAERIAAELLTKLGISVAAATVRKYLAKLRPQGGPAAGRGDQRWSTFVKNHAKAVVACDFCTTVTAGFRTLYVFVVMEVGSRRLLHVNVTAHPTAAWTLQQLREALPGEHGYRFLIHDRDSIYSRHLDRSIASLGVSILRTPQRAPRANTFVERLIGTLRRECLDYLIPFGESHLRRLLQEWQRYYNGARPHSSLGPGFPQPADGLPVQRQAHRHRLPTGAVVVAHPVLDGVHHDYRLERAA